MDAGRRRGWRPLARAPTEPTPPVREAATDHGKEVDAHGAEHRFTVEEPRMDDKPDKADLERAQDTYRWAVRAYSEALRIDDAQTVKKTSERMAHAKKELDEVEAAYRDREWEDRAGGS
jgi:hypothetical protein